MGSCIAIWRDGGHDELKGETAVCVLAAWQEGSWQILKMGGVYCPIEQAVNSLNMEAIGIELAMQAMLEYLNVCVSGFA